MEGFLNAFFELRTLLPLELKWLSIVLLILVGAAWIVYHYIFTTQPLNLLTIGERRRRDLINFIEECLESRHNEDEEVATVLREERQSLIFKELTGIIAKPTMRGQLRLLHAKTPSNISWRTIADAYNSLEKVDDKLAKGVSRVDASFGIFMAVLGGLMTLTGMGLFGSMVLMNKGTALEIMELGFLVAMAYLAIGLRLLLFGVPVLRAKQLQKYLPITEPESTNREPDTN